MDKHTKNELLEIAKNLNIRYSSMNKKQLINEIEKQQVIQKVFNNPNLRQIIFKKAANSTKKNAGIQNFNGTIVHNYSLKYLPSWMIPRKESKTNVLEAWKSKMKKQIYTSQKKKDLSIILDLFRTINVLQTEYKEFYGDNWRNWKNDYNNANSQKKINMVSNLLKNTNLHHYYKLYDFQEIRNNKGILLNIKTNKTEKFRKITSVLPNLILFRNGNVKTTNVAKQYYKLLLNIPLNASDQNRLNKSNYYFLFNKLQTKI